MSAYIFFLNWLNLLKLVYKVNASNNSWQMVVWEANKFTNVL